MSHGEPKWVLAIVDALIRFRWFSLVVMLVLIGLALKSAGNVVFDGSVEVWFLEGDEDMQVYNEFRRKFGQDEFIVVGFFGDHLFEPESVKALQQFTDEAEQLDGVQGVTSLTNIQLLEKGESGLELVMLLKQLPNDEVEASQFKSDVLANPLLSPGLVGEGGRAFCVMVALDGNVKDANQQGALLDKLRESTDRIFSKLAPSPRIRFGGTPVVNEGMFTFAQRDLMTTVPIAVLLVVVASLLLFRHWMAPAVPLFVVGITCILVVGCMGAFGFKATILSSPLMLLILVVGVADSIHLLSTYLYELRQGKRIAVALRDGLAHVFIPCLFTSLTTIVGFLSLTVSDLKPIKEFGLLAALGVAFAFVLSFAFVPVLLPLVKGSSQSGEGKWNQLIDGILGWMGRPSRARSVSILALTVVLSVPFAYGITLIQTSGNPMNYFREGTAIREDTVEIDKSLGGSSSFEFLVIAPDGGLQDHELLTRLDGFERWLEDEIGITRCVSIVDVLKEYQRVNTGAEPGKGSMPHPRRTALLLKRLRRHAPEEFDSFVQDDFSTTRISARVNLADADELSKHVDKVAERIEKEFSSPELRLEPTGFIKLISNMQDYVVDSQVKSCLIASVLITAMMFLLLRSWKLGIVSIVANFTPIVMGIGMMGFLGISLDPGTVMIATVAIGLVVDDTCHFLVRYRNSKADGQSTEQAIETTMLSAGRPIVFTSLILIVGFCSLGLGSFNPTVYFGLITAATIFFALIAELFISPALLRLFDK